MTKNLFPSRGDVYTLQELETLDLPDAPFLQILHEGIVSPIQTSHVTHNLMLFRFRELEETKWKYQYTTREEIPLFIFDESNVHPADYYFDIEKKWDYLDNVFEEGERWVTPRGSYRGQGMNDEEDLLIKGTFEERAQKDKYDNDVSLIWIRKLDMKFRMVHHSKPREQGHFKQFATIYAGRGKFLKFKSYYSDNDCAAHSVQLGPYGMGWGDGDPGWYTQDDERYPNISRLTVDRISDDKEDLFIMTVLEAVGDRDDLWLTKEVKENA